MTGLLRPLHIGDVRLENNLILSPMAGFTDIAFRALCRERGAGLVCTEMVAAPSVRNDDRVAARKMATREAERPVSIQVFGRTAEEVAEATRRVAPACDIVGFNFGCPAPQIKQAGCGAALLDDPGRCVEIVEIMRSVTQRPLLVKMRTGNGDVQDITRLGRALEDAGADAFILHGRTAAQMYSGSADWGAVRRLKEAVAIPVIGNGDVTDGATARRALEKSGADGLAVGRAALGDPGIFRTISATLQSGTIHPPTAARDRVNDFTRYVALAVPAGIPLQQIRNQAIRFAKGFPGARKLRTQMNRLRSADEVVAAVLAAACRPPAEAANLPDPSLHTPAAT